MHSRKLILYISMSLDGFIATKDDDISWLSAMEKEGEDYGYAAFTQNIDTYIVGNQTYKTVLKLTGGHFPQADQYDCYVITRQERAHENGVTYYNGALKDLIQQIRKEPWKDIYCDGGGQIVQLLMEEDLIDEYIVSVIPIVLGDGKRLFRGNTPRMDLKAMPPKYYDTGLIQIRYIRRA